MAPQSRNRFDASLDLDDLNELIEQSEKNGFVLTQIEATSHGATKLNAAVFDAKMPNDGPFSRLVPKQDPPPAGTAFSAEVFVEGERTAVDVVR